jgi:hypothetical protein
MCWMNGVFISYLDKVIIVFLDVMLIYSKSEEEHEKHLSVASIEGASNLCKVEQVLILPVKYSLFGSYHFQGMNICRYEKVKIH